MCFAWWKAIIVIWDCPINNEFLYNVCVFLLLRNNQLDRTIGKKQKQLIQ